MKKLWNQLVLLAPPWLLAILTIMVCAAIFSVGLAVAVAVWWWIFSNLWYIHWGWALTFVGFTLIVPIAMFSGGKDSLYESFQESFKQERDEILNATEKRKRGE